MIINVMTMVSARLFPSRLLSWYTLFRVELPDHKHWGTTDCGLFLSDLNPAPALERHLVSRWLRWGPSVSLGVVLSVPVHSQPHTLVTFVHVNRVIFQSVKPPQLKPTQKHKLMDLSGAALTDVEGRGPGLPRFWGQHRTPGWGTQLWKHCTSRAKGKLLDRYICGITAASLESLETSPLKPNVPNLSYQTISWSASESYISQVSSQF